MIYYFAYGSNLDQEQMKKRCPESKLISKAVLNNYRLDFTIYSPIRKCGCADIVKDNGYKVWGLVYELTEKDLKAMDVFEGHPIHYKRIKVIATNGAGKNIEVETYEVVNKEFEKYIPSVDYILMTIKASQKFDFPIEYKRYLENIQTMQKHKGKRLFITGIPTAGKTYLAKRLADEVGGIAVILDDFRESLSKDEKYKKWTDFYLNKDEEKYLKETSPEEQWNDLVNQSEGLWPAFLEEVTKYKNEEKTVIFECVNILPHLAKKYLDFPGIILIGSSYEEILKRNIENPRWGNTLKLQELEAKSFFEMERPTYRKEAEKYNYPVFETADEAYNTAIKLIQ